MDKPEPVIVVDRFPRLLDELIDLLEGLTAEDWARPTIAKGWSVKDIAIHLLGDDAGLLSRKRDGFDEGQASFAGWEELVAWINRRNQQWVEGNRRISPRLLWDLLKFTGDQINDYFRTLDPYAMGDPVSWAGPGPAPVWLDLAREFTERWHHQQHIRDAAGRPGLMDPFFLAPVLATFGFALPRAFQSTTAAEGACATLTITGASGGTWSVVREGSGWQLYTGRPPAPTAEVVLPEDAAWRLFTKGISAEAARQQAVLRGDPLLGEQMLQAVAIIA